MTVLYDICCNEEQGRHLRARYDLSRHDLIFCERPMLFQQSLGLNTQQAWVCHACHGFVGNAADAMQHRFPSKSLAACKTIITSCRQKCGYVYCNKECEDAAWRMHHRFLCTGNIADDEEHPLVLFKQLAVESNEILLLIAQWWILEHHQIPPGESTASKWIDFCMNPWWEVATLELEQQPGAFAETAALNQSIRKLCQDAADLLNQVLQVTEHTHTIPPITALDIAKRVGACEQNAIGVRQRHPLCREVFDRDFREMYHSNIVQCLAEAGFIGGDDCDSDCEEEDDDDEQKTNAKSAMVEGDWDYSVDEIAKFLSELYIKEDGMVTDVATESPSDDDAPSLTAQEGDDLDQIFPPLDGTAMYATACKMNHSCDPNVLLVYHRNPSWQRPLTIFALAIKDIQEGEELTISYIEHSNKSLEERQQALVNYGFVCTCSKCVKEQEGEESKLPARANDDDENNLFGEDGGDEENDNDMQTAADSDDEDSEQKLQACLERLDSIRNHVVYGATPLPLFAKASSFVTTWVHDHKHGGSLPMEYVTLFQKCVQGIEQKDFALMELLGNDVVSILYSALESTNAWPNEAYRNAYWCAVVVAALGLAHRWCFLDALDFLDRGMVLGLPARTDPHLTGFMAYVEHHAYSISELPVMLPGNFLLPNYAGPTLQQWIEQHGLSHPIQYPLPDELHEPPFYRTFSTNHVLVSRPLVLRNFANGWSALTAWNDLEGVFGQVHGHRQIPVERGSMLATKDGKSMREEIVSLRNLLHAIRSASEKVENEVWSLQEAQQHSASTMYLAQHPLLEQIPALKEFVDVSPLLCGTQGPTHTNVWLGSAGTRTPLHYDSYDNWLVQVVGVKYVRLYPAEEQAKLYVISKTTSGAAAQGNMSALNCEDEDWQQHPLAQSASYTEVVLYPGDGLYIPARMWHYVRSLTPSISVNYWF
ncbi:hypothetical protein FisN_13Hh020 [Fistulifera solaris]|uniref:Uncharacterized protein n=1 Tax=Fistulifera solaris TaxID=1519565 RepID=A0A1Z5KPJ5_FISSO|nr:hypothetical protein FisN_13Hh020 [Fistulifera solaris]|eukprot:GAX27868.1 hypothetical protein FisN_13Hh020 [Fistulifera solaris]